MQFNSFRVQYIITVGIFISDSDVGFRRIERRFSLRARTPHEREKLKFSALMFVGVLRRVLNPWITGSTNVNAANGKARQYLYIKMQKEVNTKYGYMLHCVIIQKVQKHFGFLTHRVRYLQKITRKSKLRISYANLTPR